MRHKYTALDILDFSANKGSSQEKYVPCEMEYKNQKILTVVKNSAVQTSDNAVISEEEQCTEKCHGYNEKSILADLKEALPCAISEPQGSFMCTLNVGDREQEECSAAGLALDVFNRLCEDKTELTKIPIYSEEQETKEDSSLTIFIKHSKVKHQLDIPKACSGKLVFQNISDLLHIPVPKLKLIHKGKMVTQENIEHFLSENALFQAFGEVAESEDGLEKSDINVVMKQVDVERNTAIRALRRAGSLIDAIIDLGNK